MEVTVIIRNSDYLKQGVKNQMCENAIAENSHPHAMAMQIPEIRNSFVIPSYFVVAVATVASWFVKKIKYDFPSYFRLTLINDNTS